LPLASISGRGRQVSILCGEIQREHQQNGRLRHLSCGSLRMPSGNSQPRTGIERTLFLNCRTTMHFNFECEDDSRPYRSKERPLLRGLTRFFPSADRRSNRTFSRHTGNSYWIFIGCIFKPRRRNQSDSNSTRR
jgi:hypothetical protein